MLLVTFHLVKPDLLCYNKTLNKHAVAERSNRASMNKRETLEKLAGEEELYLLLGRVWDLHERWLARNIPLHSPFLSPVEQEACLRLLHTLGTKSGFCFTGGYAGATRKMLCLLPDWAEAPEGVMRALKCSWYHTEHLSHRDLLGSLMGLGITRETIGDILPDEDDHCAYLLATDTAAAYLLQEWRQAGRVSIRVEEIPLEALRVPEPSFVERRDTVSSLRLDSVVSSAFNLARGKAQDAITAGKVQVNGLPSEKVDRTVNEGDVITLRGLGKSELSTVGGTTKKGRISITIKRYT